MERELAAILEFSPNGGAVYARITVPYPFAATPTALDLAKILVMNLNRADQQMYPGRGYERFGATDYREENLG